MSRLTSASGFSRSVDFSARRTNGKRKSEAKLNLVSLMDIFTILVFFLMVNTGDVEVLVPDEKILLPKSIAEIRPNVTPVIKVSGDAIYFKENLVSTIDKLYSEKNSDQELIKPLYDQLVLAREEKIANGKIISGQRPDGYAISVMGDASVPYRLLKKVLYTCAQAGFRDVSLAVEYSTTEISAKPGPSV